jgi:hypothetical protein
MSGAAWLRGAAAALLVAMAAAAHAGRPCEAHPPDPVAVQRAMTLAGNVARALDASGAQVAAIGRIGQDLSRWGQRYSHMGLVYRDGGAWRVVHKLNHCATSEASIFRLGLGEFFLDDLLEYQAGIVVFMPEVQAALRPALSDNTQLARMHTRAYNMVAYPWSTRYQQSNQWAIETLAMTQDRAADTRQRAQAWLLLHDYRPATLHITAFTRLGARMTAANIAFDDHPNARRFSDRIDTVTVDSVFAWLQRSGMASQVLTVR